MSNKEWDTLLKTLVTYGQELLQYQQAYYSYEDEQIVLSWKTGEDSGGNCWGGTASYSATNQKQPEFIILDELLLHIDPDLKLKDYRCITSKIQFEQTSSSEYYGNGSYYDQLILDRDDLVKILENCGYTITSSDIVKMNQHFEAKTYAYIESNTPSYKKKGW